MTTSRTVPPSGQSSALHAFAASGEPMTTIRSPLRIVVVAAGEDRVLAADDRRDLGVLRDLGVAERDAEHVVGDASSSTSNSPTCTWPSAKTSVWRAAGTPRMRLIAYAVSSSEETTKSTSS